MKAPNVDSLASTPCTIVKCLDLRMDNLSLRRIVDLLRRFPCVEKLYIEVLLSSSVVYIVHFVWL
jgi:hypothetical protein